jgi:hypothetical protein
MAVPDPRDTAIAISGPDVAMAEYSATAPWKYASADVDTVMVTPPEAVCAPAR